MTTTSTSSTGAGSRAGVSSHLTVRHVLAVAASGVLLLTGAACSSDTAAPPGTTSTTVESRTGSPSASSEVLIPPGQIDAAVGQLDHVVTDAMDRTGVPGVAVAVVHGGKVIYAKGFGVRQVGSTDKIDEHTVFEIASLSKSVGATVIAAEVGKGTVAWDDPIVKATPNFALADPYVTKNVTIADMYSHRSGLPGHAGDRLEDLGADRALVLSQLRLEPLTPFRTVYEYTNFGITAAAESVAVAAGTSWEDLSKRDLYEPLGMTATSSTFADYLAAPNHAALHRKIDGNWVAKDQRNADAQSPAGGVSSSVTDMSRWMLLQLGNGMVDGNQLVAEAPLLEMRNPRMTSNPPDSPVSRSSFYGLGMGVDSDGTGRVRLTHSGAFALGAATCYGLLPAEDLGIVVLSNGEPIGLPEAIRSSFLDLVETGSITRDWLTAYGELFAAQSENPSKLAGQQPPAAPAPAQPDAAYVGTYANDYWGPATVSEANGALVLTLGPKNMPFPLQHWDGETFALTPPGENSVGVSGLTFTVDATGRAVSFTAEFFDENGLGTFTR